jgi:transposase
MMCCGIDISKSTFDVAFMTDDEIKTKQFDNNPNGFSALVAYLKTCCKNPFMCMESTGIYGVYLAKYLTEHGYRIAVVNPIKTHAFAKVKMLRNKTDLNDAILLAQYSQFLFNESKFEQHIYRPKSKYHEKLQYMVTRMDQLKKMQTQENNRLQTSLDQTLSKMISHSLQSIRQQIKQVEDEIKGYIKQDEQLNAQIRLLISINGIGHKTAWAILAYLGDISMFTHSSQVASYAGLNPKRMESGTSLRQSCLSKMGHKRLRKSMFLPAMTAAKHNPVMKAFYARLIAKGKSKKTALCAVMRKLLVTAYGVLKSGVDFDPNHHSRHVNLNQYLNTNSK